MALVLALAVASLAPCAPASAQTGPASVQYVGESPETFAENAGPGTDAVNDAMAGTASSASSSASDEPSASSPAGAASSSDADVGTQTGGNGASASEGDEGLGSITELPETGGAPLAALGSGVLLMILGLTARMSARG
jgi:hypothetical protein